MFNRFKQATLLAVMLCITAQTAHAATNASVKKVLQALYKAQDAAAVHKDIAGYFNCIDPAMTFIAQDGKTMSYDQVHDVMERMFAFSKKISGTTTIVSCTVKGDTATVVTKSRSSFTLVNPQTQKQVILASTGTDRDYWEKSDSGWHVKQTRALTDHRTVNGKPVH